MAYIIEVGWWSPRPEEVVALRHYLLKGGLLIVDDFKPEGWNGVRGLAGGRLQTRWARAARRQVFRVAR